MFLLRLRNGSPAAGCCTSHHDLFLSDRKSPYCTILQNSVFHPMHSIPRYASNEQRKKKRRSACFVSWSPTWASKVWLLTPVPIVSPPVHSPALTHFLSRFGHTSRLASLASYDDYERSQYVNGVRAFLMLTILETKSSCSSRYASLLGDDLKTPLNLPTTIFRPPFASQFSFVSCALDNNNNNNLLKIIAFLVFLGMFALVWAVVLLMLKYSLGSSRVGCAAGGKPVDVSEMRRAGIRKSARKAQIRRNWRVQVAFLACCLSIPALSFVFVNHGLHPFFSSLEEVGTISGQVGREAVEGVQIATRLVSIREGMDALVSSLDVDEYCPNVDFDDADGDANIAVLASVWDGVRHNMDTVRDFVDRHAREFAVGLSRVSEVAYYVGQKVDEAETYDWKVKCMLIILNVVNALMLLGVLLTRNGINNSPYQTILTFFVVPSFVVMTALTIAFTGVAASMAVVNAGALPIVITIRVQPFSEDPTSSSLLTLSTFLAAMR